MSGFLGSLSFGNKVKPEDAAAFKKIVLREDGTIRKLTLKATQDLGDAAWTYLKLRVVWHQSMEAAKTTKKGKELDHETAEFKNYQINFSIAAINTKFSEIMKKGWLTKESIPPAEIEWYNKWERNSVTGEETATVSDVTSVATRPTATTPVNPEEEEEEEPNATTQVVNTAALITKPLEDMTVHELISYLFDGLEYDRFVSQVVRKAFFTQKPTPSLNDMVTVAAAYIFVGNNTQKLTKKVKVSAVGQQALQVLNNNKIQAKKQDSKTLTLARMGIVLAPVVWALRNIYKSTGRTQSTGVVTSTPSELCDVALSGASQYITGGASIEDFLNKFNVALTRAREKGQKDKSSEEDMKAEVQKFHDLAKKGAQDDPLISKWNYNAKEAKEEIGIHTFYDLCIAEAQVSTI